MHRQTTITTSPSPNFVIQYQLLRFAQNQAQGITIPREACWQPVELPCSQQLREDLKVSFLGAPLQPGTLPRLVSSYEQPTCNPEMLPERGKTLVPCTTEHGNSILSRAGEPQQLSAVHEGNALSTGRLL